MEYLSATEQQMENCAGQLFHCQNQGFLWKTKSFYNKQVPVNQMS